MLKRFIIALSLTNLCFYNILLAFFYKTKFHMKVLPGTNQLLALILNELLIASLFWLAWRLAKKTNNRYLLSIAKTVVCILVLVFISNFVRDLKLVPDRKLFNIILLIAIIVLLAFKKLTKFSVAFLLLTAPFVVIVFFQSAQGIATDMIKGVPPESKQPVFARQEPSPRILWLIFDELDQRIAFIDRPFNLKLPAFDRLQQQALVANNAYPPSSETINSLPALIDGKIISNAKIGGFDKLLLLYEGSEKRINWGSQPNIFSQAKELKINTAFVGDYLPYPRFIGKDTTFCDWYQFFPQFTCSGSVFDNMSLQLYRLFTGPVNHFLQREKTYHDIHNQTKKLIANPEFGLIMIHYPIPHDPFFYKQSRLAKRSFQGYVNALELVDLTLKELRLQMEEQGTWDDTTVIISSDHWLRGRFGVTEDKRVPFIVKLAKEKQPVTYEPAFNTVITQQLVLAILRHQISSLDELVRFLRQNGRLIQPVINHN